MPRRSQSRQYSVFSHKPTHFRVKTEIDSKENSSTIRHLTLKKSLASYKVPQFETNFSQQFSNQTFIGKKSPAERSLFGQINLHMPKFKKQNITPQQINHPLKEYINAQKFNKLQRNIKRYKTTCQSGFSNLKLASQQPHMTIIPCQKFDTQSTANISKQNQTLYKLIDEIYKKINKFKEVGFTQKKINQWVQKYCHHKRKYMTDLLMKSENKHKFTESIQDYFYQKDPQKVKAKLSIIKKKINGKQRPIDQYDLIQFSHYIEEILVNKNKTKILQLRDSISQKLEECFIYNRQRNEYQFGKKLYPPEMLNFMTDLNEVEHKYGNFSNISNFNREYFVDLCNTQKDIRSKIYQLIKVTQSHKIDIKSQRALTKSSTVKLQKKPTITRQSQFQQQQQQQQNIAAEDNNENYDDFIQEEDLLY